ncbi:uncharacterized protein si:ch211-160b11.4 isoform X2 [Channa argus]|uniref:uncharacterized protein si:ch211-160b11.4 isoform X2 n=1 Tax=Channa argus TaxID=215402 RepID=UPI0035214B4F
MEMKTLVLLSLSLTALALPPFPPHQAQSSLMTKEEQRPALGDWVPLQGHVEVEHPGPQARPGPREQQEQMAPDTLDIEQPKSQSEVEQEVKVKPEVKVEQELEAEPEVKSEVKVEQELKAEPEVKAEVKVDQELKAEPDIKLEPEVDVLMKLESESEKGEEVQERHIDMERTYEMAGGTVMELEPQNDDMFPDKVSDTELSDVEKSLKAAFQNEGPVFEPLAEEKTVMEDERNNEEGKNFDKESIINLKPFLNDEGTPEIAPMDEGPALDFMGYPIPPLKEYYPNDDTRLEMDLSNQQDSFTVDGMAPGSVDSRVADMMLFREPVLEVQPVLDGDAQTGGSYCNGVILEGKCYLFFKGPKKAVDAEFFCQEHFPGGHLASITSHHIHREMMYMMLKQNGAYTRTWIGGLRYLETGRFIWLDGSQWVYDDWLVGEPNNTANLEDCVELLALGDGKFNDFTCWEPQAFICSFNY